jgi:hypothetical protein
MKFRSVYLAGVCLGAVSLFAPVVASASEPMEPVTVEVEMTLSGFDHEIAAENGYEIRTTAEGREYSVPVGTSLDYVPSFDETAPPANGALSRSGDTRTSNCGSSSVSVDEYTFSTGYAVNYGVLYSKWGVTVSSPGAFQDFNLDHGPRARTGRILAG